MALRRAEPAPTAGPGPRGLAVGLVALAPLFAAYEVALAIDADGARNLAERLSTRALALAPWEHGLRIALLAVAIATAFLQVRLASLPLGRALVRTWIEGALLALALGPLLAGALALCGVGPDELGLAGGAAYARRGDVALPRALLAFGGAAWEELVFRVGAYGAIYGLTRALLGFFGAAEAAARACAEVAAVALSALLFAAFHLDAAAGLLGLAGERFDEGVFWWRAVAGVFLAGLFRWRGPGVTGWTHGLFNLALILGSGPGVFR